MTAPAWFWLREHEGGKPWGPFSGEEVADMERRDGRNYDVTPLTPAELREYRPDK